MPDRKRFFSNLVELYRLPSLTNPHRHKQLGEDFRPSHSEDGGSVKSGDIPFARITGKKEAAAKVPPWPLLFCPQLRWRALSGGKGWQPTTDGRGRTTARAHSVVFVGHMHASEN